jgi:putative ABC transport system substrate-binding protein
VSARLVVLTLAVVAAFVPTSPADARWSLNPTVTVAGTAGDARIQSVIEAVEFWNRQLSELGSPLRLGPVTHTTREVPTEYLQQLSVAVLRREPHPAIPDLVREIPGHVVVALSEGEFVSFAASIGSPGRVLVGIRRLRIGPLALPNVARNLIAHEFGHVLGLRHNSDPTTLMCGRPAPCAPDRFAASASRYFAVTEAEKRTLLRLYPRALAETPQTGKIKRVGMLWQGSQGLQSPVFDVFLQNLAGRGYHEGRNVTFVHRWSESRHDSLPDLATELVRLKSDALVAMSTPAIHVLSQATTTIPIVVLSAADPVDEGLITSLARPGGNITGVTGRAPELSAKLLELLKESTPKASRIAVMGQSATVELRRNELEAAARSLGVRLQFLVVTRAGELDAAFEMATKERAEGVVLLPTFFFAANEARIAELALRRRLPTIFWRSWFAEAGGLMAYGPDNAEQWRRAGTLVAKILGGAKPADLPIEQADRFRLVINLKTARALGLTIPPTLLLRADQVIE